MKYLKTIDISSYEDAIRRGQIRLQVGQWVRLASGQLSRFVGVSNSKVLWVAHSDGHSTHKPFYSLVSVWRQKRNSPVIIE